ncbi:MAG TPA: DUF1587 domain-containing protein, partial [Planctomycetota bacterium]|nr:DUF1587 domain-containing protein [Planctomycetota bacterium]
MRCSPAFLVLSVFVLGGCDSPPTPQGDADSIEHRFAQIQPFFERYCFGCHGARKPKGDLDLSHDFTVAAIAKSSKQWDLVRARLQDQEMPPEDAPKRPKPDERAAAIAWLRDVGDREARRNAGDPGIVLARRLSNAEYDYTIRDLTGVDIRPTREFPVDPANEAGFDNSGESLTMSEALLRKYLAAARHVADHVVLNPGGIVFAPHPVVTDTDRDMYCVQRIVAFYRRHEVDIAKYFASLRRYQHRDAFDISLNDIAEASGLSAKYLSAIESLLKDPPPRGSPVEELWTQWAGGAESEQLAEIVTRLRAKIPVREDKLEVKGISRGSQPFLLWRNDQLASQHRAAPVGADAGVARFCGVFPDAFVVLERGPYYDKSSSPKGRFLSAGFHLMQGYYRDDGPLYDLVLEKGFQAEIDTLWNELHFIGQDALRQFKDFIFFERAEPPRFMFDAAFDFARSEDKDATSSVKMAQLKRTYLTKAGQKGASDAALNAIEDYFTAMDARIRGIEEYRRRCEPQQLAALQAFAGRAFRRPLT